MADGIGQFQSFEAKQRQTAMRLVYFVHDLGDAAVARRIAMLQPYLESAVIIGFHRRTPAPLEIGGWPAVSLGCTEDGQLRQRAVAVLRNRMNLRRLRRHLAGAQFIMARQLEMLVLAAAAARRYAKTAVLAYECLDIHRVMVGPSLVSRMLRLAEHRLLRQTDLVIVSSPSFVDAYLLPAHGAALPTICLIENKVLHIASDAWPSPEPRPPGPPWRIGWYGNLRCRRSLELLTDLARKLPGNIIVDLRGRPARSAIPEFDAIVAAAPNVNFLGPYNSQAELDDIYRPVHFTWALDFYEAGLNSEWLLPNRLYEGGLHGAIPIATANAATGHWLARHNTGILLREPLAAELFEFFSALNSEIYAGAVAAHAAVPATSWADSGEDGRRLAAMVNKESSSFLKKRTKKLLLL